MPASRNIDSWQQVESRADFATYLRFLAFDRERACGAKHRTHQSINGFLLGWVRLLGSRIDGTDLLHEEAPESTGLVRGC
ncbi:hypothetical protein [Kitasatospora sp. NPDC087315]|uniref:hypothetical protein n=1 Tax=Kitasatospora sp. NPDC087315 TaxID=3364069 RepID=UPI003813CB6B